MTITGITVVQGIALQPGPKGDQGLQGAPGTITNLDVTRGWMTPQYQVPTILTYLPGGVTVWDTSALSVKMALNGGNTTMGPPVNVIDGAYYALRMVQDATTPRFLTWDAHYHWPGGAVNAVQPSNVPGAVDIFHFRGAVGNVLEFVGAQLNLTA